MWGFQRSCWRGGGRIRRGSWLSWVQKKNLEGELLLEFAQARDLVVANTWFTKKEKQMVTHESGGNRSMIGYILVRKRDMRRLTDATIIPK